MIHQVEQIAHVLLLGLIVAGAHSAHAAVQPTVHRDANFRALYGAESTIATPAKENPLGWWVGFRNGFQNTGVSPVEVRQFAQSQAGRSPWNVNIGGIIWGTPVIDAAGNIYVGSADKKFYSLTPTGQVRWTYTLPDAADSLIDSAAALVPGGLVVVPGGDGNLHALKTDTGELVWRFAAHHATDHEGGEIVNSFEGNVTLGPTGLIYAGSDNGYMYCLDTNGKEKWNFKTGFMIWSAPAFDPQGKWMAFGSLDRGLYFLDPVTGAKLGSYRCGADIKASPCVDEKGNIYVGCADFYLYSFSTSMDANGRLTVRKRWTSYTGGEIYSSCALANGKVIFGSHDGYIYCLGTDGKLIWKYGVYTRVSASPLITKDGVVLVGAKSGKLYALDLESGQRLWSLKTAPGLVKCNLDASPALSPDGRVFVCSYDGRIYSVPFEYAIQNPQNPDVNLSPGHDIPQYDGGVPLTGGALRFQDDKGVLPADPPGEITPSTILTYRFVCRNNGELVPKGAVASTGLVVNVEPPTAVEAVVGSDSYSLTLVPKTFWKPGVRYTVKIRGRYFVRTNPLVDQLKWWLLPSFTSTTSFTVKSDVGEFDMPAPGHTVRYSVRGIYVSQPEILDTLIPAAADGQAFITTLSTINTEKKTCSFLVMPAYPNPDGVILRAAPEKVFAMDGSYCGSYVRLEGPLFFSAMGGTISFQPFRFFASLKADGVTSGQFHAVAPVRSIQGSGNTYNSPSWSTIDDLSDFWLRLQAIGTLRGDRLAAPEVPVKVDQAKWINSTELEAQVTPTTAYTGNHLLTAMIVDPQQGRTLSHATVIAPASPGTSPFLARFKGLKKSVVHPGCQLLFRFDGEPVASPVPTAE